MKLNPIILLSLNLVLQPVQAGDALTGAATSAGQSAANDQIVISEAQLTNLDVKTGPLQLVTELPVLYAPAKIVIPPDQDYIVSASQAGLVSQLNVAVGDRIERGQLLAVIKSPDLLVLQRQYLSAVSEQQLAGEAYRRDKKLLAETLIADRRFQQTRSRYVIANSNASEAAQLLRIAGMSEAAVKQLARRHRLSSELEVLSPINGVVLEKMVVVGMRINGQTPLYHIADIDRLWLEINIPHERIEDVRIGDLVSVAGTSLVAKISLIGHSVNPVNQTILVRAVIEGSQDLVRPGQGVNTQIIKKLNKPVYKVSDDAIAQKGGQSYIFIRNDRGFRVCPVRISGKENGDSFISGDLTGDETIATRGGVALKADWMGLGSGN